MRAAAARALGTGRAEGEIQGSAVTRCPLAILVAAAVRLAEALLRPAMIHKLATHDLGAGPLGCAPEQLAIDQPDDPIGVPQAEFAGGADLGAGAVIVPVFGDDARTILANLQVDRFALQEPAESADDPLLGVRALAPPVLASRRTALGVTIRFAVTIPLAPTVAPRPDAGRNERSRRCGTI